ncbi:MAG: DUF309 domain-containing protein [Desulfobacterales bacterium]|jgi:hypothetical protein
MAMISSEKFDPFTDRTARDIRNTLSEAFVAALGTKNPDVYLNTARQWLKQNLSSLHAAYIDDRLLRYEQVFNVSAADDITDPLQQALIIWNHGLFFEFHDHLEAIWKSASGDKRQALKGLIKAAGVYIHLEQDHQQAAQSLASKAYALLKQYRHCLAFMANSERLLNKLKTIDPDPPQLDIASFRD